MPDQDDPEKIHLRVDRLAQAMDAARARARGELPPKPVTPEAARVIPPVAPNAPDISSPGSEDFTAAQDLPESGFVVGPPPVASEVLPLPTDVSEDAVPQLPPGVGSAPWESQNAPLAPQDGPDASTAPEPAPWVGPGPQDDDPDSFAAPQTDLPPVSAPDPQSSAPLPTDDTTVSDYGVFVPGTHDPRMSAQADAEMTGDLPIRSDLPPLILSGADRVIDAAQMDLTADDAEAIHVPVEPAQAFWDSEEDAIDSTLAEAARALAARTEHTPVPPVLAPAPPLLTLTGVCTDIGRYHILHGVDLVVPKGGVTMLLGRNGAGKTTTLRTIMGLWRARMGTIDLAGEDIARWRPHRIARKGIGFVPEDMGIFGDLTVAENMALAARSKRLTRDRMDWIFRAFPALQTFWRARAGDLSGGQKQMLSVARAMAEKRRLYLIDEPTKGLAPAIVDTLAGALRDLKEQGGTILMVEQNFAVAAELGDTAAVMEDGRIVWAGEMAELAADRALQARYLGLNVEAA